MKPDFETALGDLLASYGDIPAEEIISALELAIYAIKEAEQAAKDDGPTAA